jgi:alpha-L-fucosidase
MLADIVSKNGNLMLSIPLRGDGTPDPTEIKILEQIAAWMDVNQEAIFATRPWKIYGEGPSTVAVADKGPFGGIKDTGDFTASDIRYTQTKSGDTLYAIALGWPENSELTFAALAQNGASAPRPIATVSCLGSTTPVSFTRDGTGLHLRLPAKAPKPGSPAFVFKISWAH